MRNFKRLFAFLLVLAMAASLTAAFAAAEDTGFSDVNAGAWYAGAVRYCRDNDLMSGTSATAFSPDAAMTRAMFAVVLHRAQGSPAAEFAAFSDVPAGAWYSNAAAWASQKGMISGYGNGLFGAGDPVTREQAAVILWRYAGRPAPSQTAEAYVDQHSISAYALDAVAWARENGVMTGLDGNRFAPKSSLTRAQAAVILMNGLWAADPTPAPGDRGKTLVAYFSATGNTGRIAGHLETVLDADLYEIVPKEPYTADDLNYTVSSSRANQEQNDPGARPAISGSVSSMDGYDVVFLGYPIWHGQAPKIICTFLESYDFTGKTIVPFCTSGSSPIGSSATNLYSLTAGANWLSGRRFSAGASLSDVESWVYDLDLPDHDDGTEAVDEEAENQMYLQVFGAQDAVWTAALEENSSAEALKELLRQGPLTIRMHDYGNMEKVGPVGQVLPADNQQITTGAGDIILYQGSNLVIYYDTNTWNFTRLGRVNNVTQDGMKAVFGDGDVTVILSLEAPEV